jgi:cell division septation protein DedD
MTKENEDRSDNDNELSPDFDTNPRDKNQRLDPRFSRFEDDDEEDEDAYEEPDRDTNYSSGYSTDSVEEEDEFEDPFLDEDEDPKYQPSSIWSEPDQSAAEEPDSWLEKEVDLEEDESRGQSWPVSLIIVAILALILLAAGGFGVMQERSATQEELLQLRATLATTANPEGVSASREALQETNQSYDQLAADVEALSLENRRLADTVAGLEAQLGVQQAVLTKSVPAANQVESTSTREGPPPQPIAPEAVASKPSAPAPVRAQPAAAKPATTQPVATASSGIWFVNFGSYTLRTMADSWAAKIRPVAGQVIVAPSTKDGKTFYRVRVIGLASKDYAREVARKLEAEHRLSALWVGQE